jgi:hypothetical protein
MNQWDLFANTPTLHGIYLYTEPNDPINSHEFKSYLENPDFKKKLLEFLDRNTEYQNAQNSPFDEFTPLRPEQNIALGLKDLPKKQLN